MSESLFQRSVKPLAAGLPFVGLLAVICIVAIELAKSALGFSLPNIVERLSTFRSSHSPVVASGNRGTDATLEMVELAEKGENIFLGISPREVQIPHPMVDMLGVLVQAGVEVPRDYFGFRNWHGDQIYEDAKTRDYELVVFFGNSEGAGWLHPVSIAENLEKILSQKRGVKVKVLNLAVNGHSSSHALNCYLYFAHHLKPDFVILHFGGSEFIYAKQSDPRLIERGMFYDNVEMVFAAQTADKYIGSSERFTNMYSNDPKIGLDPACHVAKCFQDLLASHGGHLIYGLQKLDGEIGPWNDGVSGWEYFYDLLRVRLVEQEVDVVQFADMEEIMMSDNIHSKGGRSPKLIAKTYANRIGRHLSLAEEK